MYENVGTRLPTNVVKDIEYLAEEEKTDKSKIVRELLFEAIRKRFLELALKKYLEKKISLGRAAELARIPIIEFMKILAEKAIVINYSMKSLEEDFKKALG